MLPITAISSPLDRTLPVIIELRSDRLLREPPCTAVAVALLLMLLFRGYY